MGSGSSKPRPDELDIKPFVNERPLPVPTPSREAMLTQKLEVTIKNIFTSRGYLHQNLFPGGSWHSVPTIEGELKVTKNITITLAIKIVTVVTILALDDHQYHYSD